MATDRKVICEQLEEAEHHLERMRDKFLRDSGWAHTCNHPGCVWLWEKEVNGRVYVCSRDLALSLQESIDWLECELAESDETVAD